MNILKTTLLYAFSALGLSAVAFSYYVFLPKYYVDTLGVSAFWFGIIVILTRVGDAVIDPLIGKFVDLHQKFRKLLILIVALPLAISFYALSNPLIGTNQLLWFFLFSVLFYVSWSGFSVPYQSLGLSLSSNSEARTKILGTREAFLLLGTVLAALLPVLITKFYSESNTSFTHLSVSSIFYGILLLIGALLIYYFLPNNTFTQTTSSNPNQNSLKTLLQIPGFKILLITYALISFGSTLSGAMILFYIDHVLESDLGNQLILLYFLGVLIFIPFWIYWTKKMGKRRAWLQSLTLSSVSFLAVIFLGAGDQYYYLTIIVLSSFALGGAIIVPATLQADVAEEASKTADQNLDAQMIGYWSLAKKLSAAVAAGCAFPILELIGYQTEVAPSSTIKIGLIILYAGIPALCYFLAIYFAAQYRDD